MLNTIQKLNTSTYHNRTVNFTPFHPNKHKLCSTGVQEKWLFHKWELLFHEICSDSSCLDLHYIYF